MKNNIYPLTDLEIPMSVIEKFGPFHEFAQDASMVSIELKNGTIISGVLIVYPNYVGAIEGENELIFPLINIKRGNIPEIAPIKIGKRKMKKNILNFSPFMIISSLFSSF